MRGDANTTLVLGRRQIRAHLLQRWVGALVAPLWVPLAVAVLRFRFGYRLDTAAVTRSEYRALKTESSAPLLVCANHLTLIDSFLIAWALASGWRHVLQFDSLPWNTPEQQNFAATPINRLATYLAKCIPIRRGGNRKDVASVLSRVVFLLQRGETALIFPEGGRSRTGRIELNGSAWGVGRIVGSIENCRVLCVYIRGDHQKTWADYPIRGERFRVSLACIEPKSNARGVRRSRDLADQIVQQLKRMENDYLSETGLSVGEPDAWQ